MIYGWRDTPSLNPSIENISTYNTILYMHPYSPAALGGAHQLPVAVHPWYSELGEKRTWHKPKTTRNLDQQTLLKPAARGGQRQPLLVGRPAWELKLTNTSLAKTKWNWLNFSGSKVLASQIQCPVMLLAIACQTVSSFLVEDGGCVTGHTGLIKTPNSKNKSQPAYTSQTLCQYSTHQLALLPLLLSLVITLSWG